MFSMFYGVSFLCFMEYVSYVLLNMFLCFDNTSSLLKLLSNVFLLLAETLISVVLQLIDSIVL